MGDRHRAPGTRYQKTFSKKNNTHYTRQHVIAYGPRGRGAISPGREAWAHRIGHLDAF